MLKLKLWYLGHLMWRAESLKKTRMLGKIEGKRRRGQQKMKWLDSITNSMDMNLSKLQRTVKDKGAWHAAFYGLQRVKHNLMTEQQQNTTLTGRELEEWIVKVLELIDSFPYMHECILYIWASSINWGREKKFENLQLSIQSPSKSEPSLSFLHCPC